MGDRRITVRGVGSVTTKPDLVVIAMDLAVRHADYAKAMEQASAAIDEVRAAVTAAGHGKDQLKTSDFRVDTEYENVQNDKGEWRREFIGYRCAHSLKLEFPLDMGLLDRTLAELSTCSSAPEVNISFTVKDPAAVSHKLLAAAIGSAVQKAGILASSAGVRLGKIVAIDYDWSGHRLASPTCYAQTACNDKAMMRSALADIVPEDIKTDDSVTVVWDIE